MTMSAPVCHLPPARPIRGLRMTNQQLHPKIVLATFGTDGDLHPFLGLALALRARGLQPVLAAGEIHRAKVEAEGIPFHAMAPDVDAAAARLGMDRQQLTRAIAARPEILLTDIVLPSLREAYEKAMAITQDAAAVVTHAVTYGAKLAAEKRGLPHFGIALQPMMLMSVFDPPIVANLPRFSKWVYRRGRVATRAFLAIGKRVARRWAKPIDALRRDIGLPPAANHPLFEGQFTEEGAIAMFSPLFGTAQPDHPRNTCIVGFPFYDSEVGGTSTLSAPLQRFLDAGPPPVVFTQGTSAVNDADDFVHESLAAARKLHMRALLVLDAERAERWSSEASKSVMITDYAPYSQVFPRASIIVHHGGVGTTAQALRAGRPQLIVPCLVDQPDNADRVVRLGAGRTLARKHYRAARVAAELLALADHPHYAARAANVAETIASEDGAAAAADVIVESLIRSGAIPGKLAASNGVDPTNKTSCQSATSVPW